MKLVRALLLLAVCFAGPVQAQDYPEDYDPTILPACLAEQPRQRQMMCIFAASDACMRTEAGMSTLGVGTCFGAEWQQWDRRLNVAYQALLIQQADVAEDNAAFNENIPNALDLLRKMQREWIVYRDTTCEWEYVQWGGGTGGGPASAACMLRLTALQTLFLEDHL